MLSRKRVPVECGGLRREALECFNQAWDLWEGSQKNQQSATLKRRMIDLLLQAIRKAGAPFPRAHSWIALFLEELGDEKQAMEHASFALLQNPNEFRAQMVKVDCALKGARFKPQDSVNPVSPQGSLRFELLRLIQIFRNNCQANPDADEFLYMADMLILYGNFIEKIPLSGGRPNLYAEIIHAPIDSLIPCEREADIQEVRAKAENLAARFKA